MDELENEKVRVIYAETQRGGRTSGRNDERRPSEFISSWATPFVFIVHQPSIVSSPPLSDSRPAPSVGSEFHGVTQASGNGLSNREWWGSWDGATWCQTWRTTAALPAKWCTCVYISLFPLFSTVGGSNKEEFCLWIKIRIRLFIKNGGKCIMIHARNKTTELHH